MVTGGATEEAVRSPSKAEETEVWAQARDSVSRSCRDTAPWGRDSAGVDRLPCSGGFTSQIQVLAGPALPGGSRGRSPSSSLWCSRAFLGFLGFQLQRCGLWL